MHEFAIAKVVKGWQIRDSRSDWITKFVGEKKIALKLLSSEQNMVSQLPICQFWERWGISNRDWNQEEKNVKWSGGLEILTSV